MIPICNQTKPGFDPTNHIYVAFFQMLHARSVLALEDALGSPRGILHLKSSFNAKQPCLMKQMVT